MRLGVNIDHIATIRQARGTSYPSIVDAVGLLNHPERIALPCISEKTADTCKIKIYLI